MKPDKSLEFVSAPSTYNDAYKQAIQEARQWVLDWYDKRATRTNPATGKPFVSQEQLQQIHDRLAHVKVITGKDSYVQLMNLIVRGKIKDGELSFEEVKQTDSQEEEMSHEEQINLVQQYKQYSKKIGGFYIPDLGETVIAINDDTILRGNLQYDKTKFQQVCGNIKQIAVHELSHAATFDSELNDPMEAILTDGRELIDYWDNPDEVRSRLNEFRLNMGLTPDQFVTPEQVQQMRQESFNNDQRSKQQIDQLNKTKIKTYDQLPFDIKGYDPVLFKRYSDTDIQQMLNEVAQNRSLDELDAEHAQAAPDRVASHRFAMQTPSQNEATRTQSRQYHHRLG